MFIKRLFDIIVSALALIMLLPVFLIVMLVVRIKLGSPVLFRQVRPGRNGKPFEMIKFRTMLDAFDDEGEPLPDSERLTSFGKILRSSSLDELPELWNVLKGDMSIVGPRPLLQRYMPYYTARELKRHNVRPGITGLAQVSGRNAITWERKLELDVYYVENYSFWFDIRILFLTVKKIVVREGILEAAPQGSLDSYRSKKSVDKNG